ncbi:hypothetical protein G6F60_005206 [Rhizopus arrhizus]|uniref:Endonuclease/exonuclease/phosphatase domain-containing protein n=1 Tax=Rhizopus oryzae TaxID=64495 RepID=A0A9P7BTX7_RHIOR|nr:hypothetical protein G6F33_007439 [Rhizopus arrhizus]KAG1309991.1 hypothetical protein G6F64_004885 [Rhizopus arrhizus]KAG1403191.1 hypothetical protein G6F60_005206 [Rhizopus arrhizus]
MSVKPPPKGKSIDIEELRRLKQAKKEMKKALNKNAPPPPPPPKVLQRQLKEISTVDTGRDQVRIMSFNILAQSLIKRELFPDSGDILKWKTRRSLIVEEIGLYDADIMSLQEVDNFDSFFKENLFNLGYETVYCHHPSKKHGCTISYKKDKFNQVKYQTIDYNTDTLCSPSIMTNNIGQILALEYKENPSVGFVVGNTHMYWRPSCNYERLRQTAIYVKHLLDLKSELSSHVRWMPLLLGDFNTTPDDPVYSILTENKLTPDHLKDLRESLEVTISNRSNDDKKEGVEPEDEVASVPIDPHSIIGVEELVSLFQLCKDPWKSIYSHTKEIQKEYGLFGEPSFTNYTAVFKGTLDYLFIQRNMSVKRILMLPSEEDLKPSLPNRNFGSDHLCLVADVELLLD